MLLVLRLVPKLAEDDGASSAWRVIEERTRDQSIRFSPLPDAGIAFTGDAAIDTVLARYRRPAGLGAA